MEWSRSRIKGQTISDVKKVLKRLQRMTLRLLELVLSPLRLKVLWKMDFDIIISQNSRFDEPHKEIDNSFKIILERHRLKTMVPWQGLYDLYRAILYIHENRIEGDIVECGIWRGGAMAVAADTLVSCDDTNRKIFMYDTFTGMPKPTEKDISMGKTSVPALDLWEYNQADRINLYCYSSRSDVEKTISWTKYPRDRFVLIEGKVEETIPNKLPEKISLLRLDTDWYESTIHELKWLFPSLSDGGILIVDDYGAWSGSKQAVDEYFSDLIKRYFIFRNHIDGGIMLIK